MPARVTHPVVYAQNTQVGARNEPETRAHGTLHTGSPVGQRGTAGTPARRSISPSNAMLRSAVTIVDCMDGQEAATVEMQVCNKPGFAASASLRLQAALQLR